MDLKLTGKTVKSIDYQFVEVFLNLSNEYSVILSGNFSIHTSDDLHCLKVGGSAEDNEYKRLNDLIGCEIKESSAAESSALIINFANGYTLKSEPQGAYEPWSVAGPNGLWIVCKPSGGLSIWGPVVSTGGKL